MKLEEFDVTKFQFTKKLPPERTFQRTICRGAFLKGPVPLAWFEVASRCVGRAFQVGFVLWYLAGVKGTREFPVSYALLQRFGVDRYAAYRAVRALEHERLIHVTRGSGRSPIVRLLAER